MIAHSSQFEGVGVPGPELPGPLSVGWHYGDPSAATLSGDEEWCVSVGCGLIAYRLRPPWWGYDTRAPTPEQYWTFGTEPDPTQWWGQGNTIHVFWLRAVRPLDGHRFVVTGLHVSNQDGELVVREYVADCGSRSVEFYREWIDTAALKRREILADIRGRGRVVTGVEAVPAGLRLTLDDERRQVTLVNGFRVWWRAASRRHYDLRQAEEQQAALELLQTLVGQDLVLHVTNRLHI